MNGVRRGAFEGWKVFLIMVNLAVLNICLKQELQQLMLSQNLLTHLWIGTSTLCL